MNPQVLESLALICPTCRHAEPLRIGSCIKEEAGYFIEGFLDCTNPACHRRYPVIAGVPVILKDMAAWWRSIGSEITASLSGDILEYFSATVQKGQDALLGTYLQSHYDSAYWKTLGECLETSAP
jgi:uncharacterized protein YbaR (Trm112 family)